MAPEETVVRNAVSATAGPRNRLGALCSSIPVATSGISQLNEILCNKVSARGVPSSWVNSVGSVFKFFALNYLATWSCWIPAVAISDPARPHPGVDRGVLLMVGTVAPAVVALVLTWYGNGRSGRDGNIVPIASRECKSPMVSFRNPLHAHGESSGRTELSICHWQLAPFGHEGCVATS
jgi:hypothetical protein